jgi:hypothetical protein
MTAGADGALPPVVVKMVDSSSCVKIVSIEVN